MDRERRVYDDGPRAGVQDRDLVRKHSQNDTRPPNMRRAALLLPAILLLAACSTTPPSASPSTPPASLAPSPLTGPTTPTTSPAGSPVVTPSPINSPARSMTAEEEALLGVLRIDAAVNCVPRRTDLPEGSLRGIECRPDDRLVSRVGIYWFPSAIEAAFAYMTRMAAYGVDVNAGDCVRDIPGDAPWTAGDGEGSFDDPGVFNWENAALSPNRSGCFRDENGGANVRATCGNAYVGVLGTSTDLSDLNDWTWLYPEGYEPGTPDSPGICIGDGLNAPDVPEVP
jgi:hypothetical protein